MYISSDHIINCNGFDKFAFKSKLPTQHAIGRMNISSTADELFIKKFEAKYNKMKMANWNYSNTPTLIKGIIANISSIRYKRFIGNRKNKQKYSEIFNSNPTKSNRNPLFVRILKINDFIAELPTLLTEHKAIYKINSYSPKINGEPISEAKIGEILLLESNPEIRESAYNARLEEGDYMQKYMVNLIRRRNSFAKKLGYNNFGEYFLQKYYHTTQEDYQKFIYDTYSAINKPLKYVLYKRTEKLKDIFHTDKIEEFCFTLEPDSEIMLEITEAVKEHEVYEIAKKIFLSMGFDIEKLIEENKLILDMYPKKHKAKDNFCMPIIPGETVGVNVNYQDNYSFLKTLCHELGHAMYCLGLPKDVKHSERYAPSKSINEAIAMLMGELFINEDILQDIIPKETLQKARTASEHRTIITMANQLALMEFEKEMYEKPDQDLAKLWQAKQKKFLNRDINASNIWAISSFFITTPFYLHNYISALTTKTKLYNHLKNVLGNLTENPNTAQYLEEHIFSYGATMPEKELLAKILNE